MAQQSAQSTDAGIQQYKLSEANLFLTSHSYGASPAAASVIYHPTLVNVAHLNRSHAGQYSIYLPQRDGRLS